MVFISMVLSGMIKAVDIIRMKKNANTIKVVADNHGHNLHIAWRGDGNS